MLTHEELVKEILSDPEVKVEYNKLEKEYDLLDRMITKRKQRQRKRLRKRLAKK